MFKQTDAMKDDTQELTLFDNYDFIEKIESLMADCESAEVEFKSARGGFPGSLWETYSAFANTQGGVIVLGVKEKDGKFTLDGITLEQARKYKKEFWDNVNNKAHCSANVLQEKDVQDGEYNGSYVLVFNVPRAPRNKIPVYLHNNPENTFKRNYEGDFRCDASEIQHEEAMPITTGAYLYLSGTPFRAISSGEFIEEQVYNWTYSDEQRAKASWNDADGPNPYAALPRMVMMTYQLPDELRQVAIDGEFDEFDLNLFFRAEGNGDDARFVFKNEVQKWLDLIRGAYVENIVSDLKLGHSRPPMPFSHAPLLSVLTHTFWFLPSVASCYAMRNLLAERQNRFYQDYRVVVAAGSSAGIGVDALAPVLKAMGNPLETKTITLSCGKLTTGVSVKPWSGIFMLRNSSSPETYFQAAFRVQTPWTVCNADGVSPNRVDILKQECYVFDFAPNRALRQIADYSCRLNVEENNPERKVEEFISFLPVLAYDGSSMKQIDAAGILDIAMSGTTATLLARRWESALLVNVDNATLRRLMGNAEAMAALTRIEGFRNLNQDIETIINKSEAVKKARKETPDEAMTPQKKRELTEEEKEYKSLRKQIQEKLIKFATRVPIFMYLTDFRERSLYDVITQLEPGLFKKVTGLSISDFELLVSLDVFNSALMNDAIYKFKRYEDASLTYVGINRHANKAIGLYNTVI